MSDLHGHLPELPDSDILIVAGDICPYWNHRAEYQEMWLNNEFKAWLQKANRPTFACWGNHDFVGELGWPLDRVVENALLREVHYTRSGLTFFGFPWVLRFGQWAFGCEESDIERRLQHVEADVLLSHGPPFGACDGGLGSTALRNWIEAKQPKLVVCGHIHYGRGLDKIGNTVILNAAMLNDQYEPQGTPTVYEL